MADLLVDTDILIDVGRGVEGAVAALSTWEMRAGIPLVSKNQKDYRYIEGLDFWPYPS